MSPRSGEVAGIIPAPGAIGRVRLGVELETFPLKTPFRITGHTLTDTEVVTVTLECNGHAGRGEAAGVFYRAGEDARSIYQQIGSARAALEAGIDRGALARLLPASGARNAIDCALWDLEARLSGVPAWERAGLGPLRPLLSTYTVGADDPARMAAVAQGYGEARAIKLKLTGQLLDVERVRAVRAARPDVWLGVDANQGLTRDGLARLMPVLVDARVRLIEQPFAVGAEAQLEGFASPIPIAADESAQGLADLPGLLGRFDVVNIKLDKCGGLTEGLAMARGAQRLGLRVMVGNMIGSSLAMAPAVVLGQLCDVVDLDGPILLTRDRSPCAVYADGMISCPRSLWGARVG